MIGDEITSPFLNLVVLNKVVLNVSIALIILQFNIVNTTYYRTTLNFNLDD